MTSFLAKLPLRRSSRDDSSKSETPKPKQIYAPRALPTKRKRTLTLPLPPSSKSTFSRSRQHTSPQSNCLFLQKLPYDIRRIIYDDVLCGNIFHIIRMRRRLRHLRCSTEDGEPRDLRATCWGILKVDGRSIKEFYADRMTDGDILPLLRTCRAIYTETIPLVYTNNTFDLNGLESALLLSSTLLPHRLNSITSLRLTWAFFQSFLTSTTSTSNTSTLPLTHRKALFPGDEATWKASWKVIAGMQALRDVRIWLAMSPATEMSKACEWEMLSPLREVGRKRVFKVRVNWTVWDGDGDGGKRLGEEDGEREEVVNYEIIRQVDQDWGAGRLRLQNG